MKLTYLLSLLLIVISGCNAQTDKDEAKQVIAVKIPEADSLMSKMRWEASDYEKGVVIFKKINERDEYSLMNYAKNEGRLLFERLTDYRNYDSLTVNKTREQQFEICTKLTDAINRLSKLCYNNQRMNGKLLLGHEMTISFMANMTLSKINIDFVNIVFPNKDSLDEVRKQGYQKIQSGTFLMINGSLITISHDYPLYQEEDIIRLARFIKSYINSVKSFLNKEQQNEILVEINKVKNSSTYPKAKDVFFE